MIFLKIAGAVFEALKSNNSSSKVIAIPEPLEKNTYNKNGKPYFFIDKETSYQISGRGIFKRYLNMKQRTPFIHSRQTKNYADGR